MQEFASILGGTVPRCRLASRNCSVRPSRQSLRVGRFQLTWQSHQLVVFFRLRLLVLLHQPTPDAVTDIVVEAAKN